MTIDMRVKIHALFLDLTKLRQRKHLESAGIGKDRSVPVHKFVKTSQLLYHLVARAHMKMISIGQFYLCTDLMKIHSGNCTFNCCNCSYIHKNRSLDRSVDRLKLAPFRSSFCCDQFIFCHFISLLKTF